ncbi:DUF4224 domain-containing protein [Congregibacter brevis]|uniref:DUF4224 domain-containing protein n=1 Tax=Congregibacter brevis TaxID=3081201 RepID=A0ABZ0IEJ9_9GAMM|nr:DUF4224 domain-containing protein [Congregibacter sp. IMCC45268]
MKTYEPKIFIEPFIIEQATGRKKHKSQTRVLREMGFRVLVTPEGKPLVTYENFYSVTESRDGYAVSDEVILNSEFL